MKPFDLQAALAGAKVVTRDGRKVTKFHLFDANEEQPLYGVVDGTIECWSKDGMYSVYKNEREHDLFMAPTEKKEWIVRVADKEKTRCGNYEVLVNIYGPFATLNEAEELSSGYFHSTIHEITVIE